MIDVDTSVIPHESVMRTSMIASNERDKIIPIDLVRTCDKMRLQKLVRALRKGVFTHLKDTCMRETQNLL